MNGLKHACKNNQSGKYFLFIEEKNNVEFLLCIPTGEVKTLEKSLFREIEEVGIIDLLNNGLLTQHQIDGYKKFVEIDSFEIFNEIMKSSEDANSLIEKLQIAQESMSKKQYEFVINLWTTKIHRLIK
ncbi:hypothetical protein [Desulfobacula sp.]|uniref:hypothetical protein n=1 Tax=Desulfobacula sp. TaxID=2593537 RepID=UPI0025C0D153|nr:hypothetical protein [Desulfobacula sp.]MBC2702950.1 hypothetical protein [Desulfobacula sp.]